MSIYATNQVRNLGPKLRILVPRDDNSLGVENAIVGSIPITLYQILMPNPYFHFSITAFSKLYRFFSLRSIIKRNFYAVVILIFGF